MKLTIGRNNTNKICIPKEAVSDVHANVWINNSVIEIEDLNSANGTFKNGRRIARTQISAGDEIKIANVKITYETLKQKIEEITRGNDYSVEFVELKKVYKKYKSDIQQLKREQQRKPLVLRIVLSMIPVIISIILWDSVDPSIRYVIMIGGSSLIFGITSMISMGHEKKLDEQREILSDEFQIKYVCPKCKMRMGVVSWTVLASQKRCRVCGAIWIKD